MGDWKWAVKNCDKKTKEKKIKPLLVTDEPLCQNANELACGDGSCIAKGLFCNGVKDCNDGSDENFWSDAAVEDWAREMAGSRLIIDKFASISDNSVVGLRAPYLRVGGNNQFTMMEEQGFLYDS